MKKYLFLATFSLLTTTMSAQSLQEVVYLKNGSVIRGTIIEQVPNQSLKIETDNGNIFVYKMEEVEKITKEEPKKKSISNEGTHPGLDFVVDMGPNFAKGATSFSAGIGVGKRFSKSFYFGAIAGATFGSGDPAFSLLLNPKLLIPINNSPLTFGIDFRAGGQLASYDVPIVNKKGTVTGSESKTSWGIPVALMPTISYPITNKIDLSLGAGYMYNINIDGESNGAPIIRLGVSFHSANYGTNKSKQKREKPAIRDNGFQLTYETGYGIGKDYLNAFSLIPTYKFNPHFSAGVGVGLGLFLNDEDFDEFGDVYSNCDLMFSYFVRGNYRLTNGKFSPFVNLDLGAQPINFETSSSYRTDDYNLEHTLLYAKPSVGLSLRTSNNTYFNIMLGYQLCTKPKIFNDEDEGKNPSFSNISVAMNFTHTFKWGNSKLNELGKKLVISRY